MDRSLTYLGSLPDDTVVYNGHEYTSGNVAFALSVSTPDCLYFVFLLLMHGPMLIHVLISLNYICQVDKSNDAIQRLAQLVKTDKVTTGKTTIGEEKHWNVFMRLESDAVRYAGPEYFFLPVPESGLVVPTPQIPTRAMGLIEF